MIVTVKQKGSTKNAMNFLKRILSKSYLKHLERYAEKGVEALSAATPVDTGKTAASWKYHIEVDNRHTRITWTNDNVNDGQNIAILLQYGHATRNGGYVEGLDYINPAMRPVFTQMVYDVWKEVTG